MNNNYYFLVGTHTSIYTKNIITALENMNYNLFGLKITMNSIYYYT